MRTVFTAFFFSSSRLFACAPVAVSAASSATPDTSAAGFLRRTGNFGAESGFRKWGVRFEVGERAAFDEFVNELFDINKEVEFVSGDEGDGLPLGAGATGPTDAVDVIFRLFGEVVVDDLRELLDINAPSGDVGGEKDFDFSVLKVVESFGACVLTLVAVNGGSADSLVVEVGGKLVCAVLGPRKDEGLSRMARD